MTNPKIGLMTEFQSVMGRDGFEIIDLFDIYIIIKPKKSRDLN